MIILSGQVQKRDLKGNRKVRQIGFQEIDIVSIVKSITKYAVTVTEPKDIKYIMEKAWFEATTGRPGPVWIDILWMFNLQKLTSIVYPDILKKQKEIHRMNYRKKFLFFMIC